MYWGENKNHKKEIGIKNSVYTGNSPYWLELGNINIQSARAANLNNALFHSESYIYAYSSSHHKNIKQFLIFNFFFL